MSVAVLLLVGDPKAGAPSVRVALGGKADPSEAHGTVAQGEFLGIDPLTESLEGVATSETPGQAIITLPGGETHVVATGAQALAAAPIAGLSQQGPGGLLPVIAADGRTAATAYARPFAANGKPKIALVIGGLGINPTTTRQAIESLPPEVTLSFAVYADDLQGWIDLARAHGHEVLLETPMEPNDYPSNDPGPYTLMASSRPEETIRRLDQVLAKATGYFGVTNYMGSRFVTSAPGMTALTGGLKRRGLAFIDDGSAARFGGGLPRASAERIIDDQLGPEAIARHLTALEAGAAQRGQALGAGFGYQVTLQQVRTWAQGLPSRGYQLAPASALWYAASDMTVDLSLYRPNVGVVLFNAQGLVWLGRRASAGEAGLIHRWQFPQGGVDDGEDLYDAARRELEEETGVVSTSLLGRTENWVAYDFPPGYAGSKAARGWRGQKQVWFALRFEGGEDEIRLDHHHQIEFDAWRWARLAETPELIVPFKRPAYEAVAAAFAKYAAVG